MAGDTRCCCYCHWHRIIASGSVVTLPRGLMRNAAAAQLWLIALCYMMSPLWPPVTTPVTHSPHSVTQQSPILVCVSCLVCLRCQWPASCQPHIGRWWPCMSLHSLWPRMRPRSDWALPGPAAVSLPLEAGAGWGRKRRWRPLWSTINVIFREYYHNITSPHWHRNETHNTLSVALAVVIKSVFRFLFNKVSVGSRHERRCCALVTGGRCCQPTQSLGQARLLITPDT